MKRKFLILFLVLAVWGSLSVGQAHALEYVMEAPEDYRFGPPTSVEAVFGQEAEVNVDRSKNVALIPPGFGTATSYLPGSGEYLTPNLVPGALNGGLGNGLGTGFFPADNGGAVPVSSVTESFSSGTVPWSFPDAGGEPGGYGIAFTDVTRDLYYSGGHLGTLTIPAVGVSVRIYEGTDASQLAKGAGHFSDTSIWDGNCCLAAHNRGTNNYFGSIHTLKIGDTVTLTTKLGTRTYSVASVKKITETDNSDTAATWENCVTLFTCVRDQRDYRWCVRAVEIGA